jgi:isopentenyldiphosphate isomerase
MQPHEEWFDVVDSSDRVIARDTRQRVHALGLMHRAVHCLILRPDGHVLLQLRSASKDKFPSHWSSSVSGHVDSGETYDQAVVREFSEELGLSAPLQETLHLLGKSGPSEETDQEFICTYAAFASGPFHPPSHEVAALEWIPWHTVSAISEWHGRPFTPSLIHILREHATAVLHLLTEHRGACG